MILLSEKKAKAREVEGLMEKIMEEVSRMMPVVEPLKLAFEVPSIQHVVALTGGENLHPNTATFAKEIAKRLNAEITVLFPMREITPDDIFNERAEEVAKYADVLREEGIRVRESTCFKYSELKEVVQEVNTRKADMVLVPKCLGEEEVKERCHISDIVQVLTTELNVPLFIISEEDILPVSMLDNLLVPVRRTDRKFGNVALSAALASKKGTIEIFSVITEDEVESGMESSDKQRNQVIKSLRERREAFVTSVEKALAKFVSPQRIKMSVTVGHLDEKIIERAEETRSVIVVNKVGKVGITGILEALMRDAKALIIVP